MLLNVGRCECPWHDLALLLFSEEGFGEPLKDRSSSVKISTSLGKMGFFLDSEWSGALLTLYPVRLFCRDCAFFLPGPVGDLFHTTSAQHDPTIP